MTYVPDWERARASKAVSAVFLGELQSVRPARLVRERLPNISIAPS